MTTIAYNFTVADLCAAAGLGDMPHLREILDAQPQLATRDTADSDGHQWRSTAQSTATYRKQFEHYSPLVPRSMHWNTSCNLPHLDGPPIMAIVK